MKMTPPFLLAALIALAFPARTLAYASSSPACQPDIPELPSEAGAPEASPPPGPLMSMPPAPESYEEGVEYPIPVRDKAVKWARVFEVPSSWLIPLGYVESRNQPLARNKSGATGAVQIKLARAKDLVTWLGRSKWKAHQEAQAILAMFWHGLRDDLLNLDLNVMLAAFELHHLRRRFGNDHRLVAAAYNQGEGCISRCLRQGLPLPARAVEFIARVRRAQLMGYT